MKKSLKIILIVIGIIAGFILLDTLQARIFKNSPIISWKEKLDGDSYVDKGILVDTYYCRKDDIEEVSWHLKNSKFTCPINEEIDDEVFITKSDACNDIKYQTYYEDKNRTIYLATCIAEVNLRTEDGTITLKEHLTSAFQKFDDSIRSMSEKMNLKSALKDGGTTIYKNNNATMIVCNTLAGNKDIYIGDSSMDYEQDMCK